jgi:alkylation response protein AidB-like acyl-CoA dehydrogenase
MIYGWPENDEVKQMLVDQIRSFAQSEIAPMAAELDKTGNFPTNIVKKLGEMGLMGMMVSDKWGGAGMMRWLMPWPWKK